MGGLPRSGSTLLSSILNENPDIYATPQSDAFKIIQMLHQQPQQFESFRLGHLHESYINVLKNVFNNMYEIKSEKIIIDKSTMWGAPYYRQLLEFIIGDRPKIICPVRPLEEIVTSFIVLLNENPETNFIDKEMMLNDFASYYRKPLNDARVDWLLSSNGILSNAMMALSGIMDPEWSDCYHVINYSNLIKNTEDSLNKIYDFLGENRYSHNFNNIGASPKNNDESVMGIKNLHDVRSTIMSKSLNPEDVLSDYALTRCKIEDFWTDRCF